MLFIAAFAWYLALAAKAVAIWRLLASGIYQRLPVLFVYFCFSFIQQAGFSLIWHRPPLYAAWYIRTEPLMLALDYAMVVSLYWAVAEFFPRFRIAGTFVLSSVSLVAAVTAYLTRAFGAPPRGWEAAWQTILIYQRGVGVVLIAVLAAARLLNGFHRLFPIRTCALRAADIMLLHGIVFVWGVATFRTIAGESYGNLAFVLGLGGSAITSILCAIFLTRQSDSCSAPSPRRLSRTEIDELTARAIDNLRAYARVLDQRR
jgi:hypothetical protein